MKVEWAALMLDEGGGRELSALWSLNEAGH